MSTARQNRGPSRAVSAIAVAVSAAVLAVVSAAPSGALPSDTPSPAPPGAPTVSCPTGQAPTLITQPPPAKAPAKPPAKPNPNVTTLPDGSTVTAACAVAPPTPIPGPAVAPEHTVGGPRLATTGVVVDKSADVPDPPVVTDPSYVIADMDSGQVLAAKSPHAWLPPASTLKTLTSVIVLPALDPAMKVVATDAEVNAEGTRVGMVSGASYSVSDLFHGLVLESGNDAAYALADAYGGRDKTIAAMNAKAGQLGAWDTVAVDPSGLDADQQRSSAYDLALFGRAVMKLPAYRTYATTKLYTFPGGTATGGKVLPPFQIQNHNTLLDHYGGAIGVKNGYTTGARHTFIGAATRDGRTLLISQMGGTVVPSWQPTAALLDWAFANAGKLTPVGTLVDGAAQPPELGGIVIPTTAGTPLPSAPTEDQEPPATPAPVAVAVPDESAGGGNPGPGLLASATNAARSPVTYAVLVLLVAGFVALRRARVRRGPGSR